MASFSLINQLQLNYSPFEDRLVISTTSAEGVPIRLLVTRRLALPLLTRLHRFSEEFAHWSEPLTNDEVWSDEPSPDAESATMAREALEQAVVETLPSSLYLATQVHFEHQARGLVVAFEGLVLPEAMREAKPHVPIFALLLNGADLLKFSHIIRIEIDKAQWNESHSMPDSYAKPIIQ